MKIKKKGIIAIIILSVFIVFVTIVVRGMVKAENYKEQDIVMPQWKEGDLYFNAYNHKATSNYRWKTIGYVVTLNPIGKNSTNKTVNDYNGVGYKLYYSEDIYKLENSEEDSEKTNTQYYFTKNIFRTKSMKLAKKYLQSILLFICRQFFNHISRTEIKKKLSEKKYITGKR